MCLKHCLTPSGSHLAELSSKTTWYLSLMSKLA